LCIWLGGGLVGCDRGGAQTVAATAQASAATAQESAAFDRYRQPDRLIAALGLRHGDRVADVGAGAGYLTFRLARGVGTSGRVLATDVDPDALAALTAHTPSELRGRVEARHVAAAEPGLEPGAYDLLLLSEVDHLLPDRAAYLRRLALALAPGGRIAVVNKRTFQAPLVAAVAAAGLRARPVDFTPTHFLIFVEVP